ncbi:GAF domain protein [Leptospira inadai serovar Lyme str. 10]|uniref:GAF domain protein n=2 Tax=Leptospira inadai serovar Lyme TaxID=293084 RepID=V6HE65_9LEPT|nr:GAF domain protein [Leptospira inadai]EQA38596.1 GAF domain protein [Leptospira inadai serovar Lyme str. 10]
MGLLDKVSRMIRSETAVPAGDSGLPSKSAAVSEKPSLLRKSMAARAKGLLEKAKEFTGRKEPEEFHSAYGDPAEFEPAPLSASAEDEFSYDSPDAASEFAPNSEFEPIDEDREPDSELPEIDFPDSTFEDLEIGSEKEDPLLNDAESFAPSHTPDTSFNDLPSFEPDETEAPAKVELESPISEPESLGEADKIEDPFSDWIKDAETQAVKEANRPHRKEQEETEKAEFLFDDDSDYSTLPIDLQIASRKKLENYLSVFEISKEIAASKDFTSFFENLSYSILGQIGAEAVVIFSSTNGDFDALRVVDAQGLDADPSWVLESGDEIYQAVRRAPSVIYAKEMLTLLVPRKEKEILEKTSAELLVPIRNHEEFYGIILLTKTVAGEDYTIEDLEFLKIVGEISGSVFRRIMDSEAVHQENDHLKEVLKSNERILSTARDLAQVRDMDEAYDRLIEILKKELGLRRWTLLLLDRINRKEYKIFGTNLLTPDTIGKFRLGLDSNLVGIVANVPGVFRIANFRKNPELLAQLTNDELGLMREFDILPFLNLNWLVGMLVIHETESPWTDTDRESAVGISEITAPILSNLLMLEERDAVFRDPFSPVESKINEAIARASKIGTPFSLTVFKVQNATRVVRMKGAGYFAYYCEELRNAIRENLGESDYCYRVGQGKYVVVLDGKDREETQIVVRKIRNRIVELDRQSKDFQTSTANQTLCFPADTKEKERLLELIEES